MAAKRKTVDKRYTKTEIISQIAEENELTKAEVSGVLESLEEIIQLHIKKRSCGEFVLPGLLKIKTVKKPARKAKKDVPNPFRPGETMDVAAKPASIAVKILPLKKLKEMAL